MSSPTDSRFDSLRRSTRDGWDRLAPVRRRVRRRFEVDARSLAAFRVALALLVLADLLHRARYIEQFYTNDGAYPLLIYEHTYTAYNGLSLHALSGELWFQQLLFVVAGLVALAMLVGYRTRLAVLLTLLLVFSLHGRNPAVLNGGDRLLRVLLIVAVLPPLGERWSVDALRPDREPRRIVTGFAVAALLLQPIVVFVSNAVAKHAGDTWYAGDALEIAMANDMMTILLGDVIAGYPGLLTLLNYGWVVLLAGSPLFLLATVGRVRSAAVFAYLGAFVGMALAMTVGLFPGLLAASVLPYLGTAFWDAVERRVPERAREASASVADWPVVPALRERLNRPPVERRALAALRERGNEDAADFAVTYARSLVTVLGIALIAWMLVYGGAQHDDVDVPDAVDFDHLDQQSWGLYAPNPSSYYSWYVVEAELEDGTSVDAVDGGPPTFDRPEETAATYDTFRHRKFMQKVRDFGNYDGTDAIAAGYAEWACGEAAARHDQPVERVVVHRMRQRSPVDGEWEEPSQRTVIEWECGTPLETAV